MTRRIVLLAVVLTVCPGPAGAQSPQPERPLSAERFAALERVLEASAATEARDSTRGDGLRYSRRCLALDRDDALLRAYRALCGPGAQVLERKPCASRRSCARRAVATTQALRKLISAAPRVNATFRREIANRRCGDAIRVLPRSLRAYKRLVALGPRVRNALLSGSQPRIRRAFRAVDRAERGIRPDSESLRLLRRDCR